MAAHVPCDPLDVPIDLTKICIVHPFHTHVVIYGDPDVEAPTLCICNEAAVPGGLLPSETLFSIRWSHGMIEPTNRSIQDALVYTALMARWHLDKPPHAHVEDRHALRSCLQEIWQRGFQPLRRAGVATGGGGGGGGGPGVSYLDVK